MKEQEKEFHIVDGGPIRSPQMIHSVCAEYGLKVVLILSTGQELHIKVSPDYVATPQIGIKLVTAVEAAVK